MENKIPTAEEFWNENNFSAREKYEFNQIDYSSIYLFAIKFAKLHVQRAIEECIESAPSGSSTDTVRYEDVVKALKDCYPLNLIK